MPNTSPFSEVTVIRGDTHPQPEYPVLQYLGLGSYWWKHWFLGKYLLVAYLDPEGSGWLTVADRKVEPQFPGWTIRV